MVLPFKSPKTLIFSAIVLFSVVGWQYKTYISIANVSAKRQVSEDLLNGDFGVKMMERRNNVQEVCKHMENVKSLDYLIQNKRWALHFLLVDEVHKNIFCFLPKTGNTNWKKVYMILSGLSNATDDNLMSISMYEAHHSKAILQLKLQKITDEALKEKLTTYTKTISVRHPFERVLSAFQGAEARKKSAHKRGHVIKWPDFVDIASSKNWNMVKSGLLKRPRHWTPYYNLCHPCSINYNYIIKFDNLVEEANSFLRDIKAPSTLQFPSHPDRRPTNSTNLLSSRMKELTGDQIDRFYETFKADFEMFQFPKVKD